LPAVATVTGVKRRTERDCPPNLNPDTPALHHLQSWDVERRHDGAVLVRVHSRQVNGAALPDAVFAFRAGDPQFAFWDEQMRHREASAPLPTTPAVTTMPLSQTG
jgi:hypothetical protein